MRNKTVGPSQKHQAAEKTRSPAEPNHSNNSQNPNDNRQPPFDRRAIRAVIRQVQYD
ncbi:MAG: hypothetical protein WA984_10905 [Phormidesmis sp.]